ncbi:MAG: hypothetical protein HC818_08065 [Synechococcaceae cyanobacterium RM1_1_27]|nr:hypothetical protein [Synechococcaceae cyanobacterium SM2_3_2]NJO86460.1 hypothetical protein [Synechococcaceae cyanobacterium RM1_1_27]
MSLSLSNQDNKRLSQANADAAFDFIEQLLDNPEQIELIQNGSHVFHVSQDPWVNTQNQRLAAQLEAEGQTVMWVEGSRVLVGAA